ncbi:MAG: 5'/3'-nucleotidase SurE [bacterium]|nr:5'/3'-nucleotidase SurE [bacterium]MBU1917784.1 5'/3'-nucleotidase SurE [bacterium]
MTKILVTNDDGVLAPGIKALAKALRHEKDTEVIVVAPGQEQSSSSHSITLDRPLRINKVSKNIYAVEGTPVDSVFMGVWAILKEKPDFIFSGINRGGNLGEDLHYSGTVSAAVEGGIMGIPSVAISQLGANKFNYDKSAAMAVKVYRMLKKHPLPEGLILNVNVPQKADLKKISVTKTGKRDYGGKFIENRDPRGDSYYWIGGNQYKFEDIKNSDCNAIVAGNVSITPIRVDMTAKTYISKMKKWI